MSASMAKEQQEIMYTFDSTGDGDVSPSLNHAGRSVMQTKPSISYGSGISRCSVTILHHWSHTHTDVLSLSVSYVEVEKTNNKIEPRDGWGL